LKRGTRHFLTCKSVVKRTQEDVDDSALSLFASLLHTHPHFNNSERRDNHVRFFILSRTLSSSRSLILDALTFVGILSFLNEAHAVGWSVGRFSVGAVRLALVFPVFRFPVSRVFGRRTRPHRGWHLMRSSSPTDPRSGVTPKDRLLC